MKEWGWFRSVEWAVTWVLVFFTFISGFDSEYYYFSMGKSIGALLSMLVVMIDVWLSMGFIKPTKPWVRHHTSSVDYSSETPISGL